MTTMHSPPLMVVVFAALCCNPTVYCLGDNANSSVWELPSATVSRVLMMSMDDSGGFPWQLVLLQLACCAVIVGVSLFGVFLPKIFLRLSRKENGFFRRHARMVESCCNGFAAGAFWGLALFHVLFAATDILSQNDIGFHVGVNFYNMVYLLSFLGYLFILVVDRLLQVVAAKTVENAVEHCTSVSGGIETSKGQTHRDLISKSIFDVHTAQTAAQTRSAVVQGVCATIALTIHSFFEGMVIGMLDMYTIILVMTLSVIGHRWAAAFALSQKLITYNVPRKPKIVMLTIFIVSSPLGIIIGMPLMEASDVVVGVFDALTVGILIYVASDTTQDVFRTTNWEALLAKQGKPMTQEVPSSSRTDSHSSRVDEHDLKHCDSKVDNEECWLEGCLTQDT